MVGENRRKRERERGQTMNSGKRSEDVCTINNQIPAATLVQPLCLSLRPTLHPSFFSLHSSSIPAFIPVHPDLSHPERPSPVPGVCDSKISSIFCFLVDFELLSCLLRRLSFHRHLPRPTGPICPFVIVRLHQDPRGFFLLDHIKQTPPKHNNRKTSG